MEYYAGWGEAMLHVSTGDTLTFDFLPVYFTATYSFPEFNGESSPE